MSQNKLTRAYRALFLSLSLLVSTGAVALPEDRDKPIQIEADRAIRNEKEGTTVYIGNVELVQGVIDIINNPTTIAAGAADDPFQVRTGYVHSNNVTFRWAPVSAGDAPLQVLVSSSDTAVGEVQTLNENGISVTVEVQENQTDSASSVAIGGVAFDPVAQGSVSISTEVIGFNNAWPNSAVSVTVTP